MSIQLTLDPKSLEGVKENINRRVLTAATRAVRATTRQLKTDFVALTKAAVPGKGGEGWEEKVFPEVGKIARRPSGAVFPNGPRGGRTWGMMEYWTQPGTNRAKGGQWLAIPTKAAGATNGKRMLTPGEWEQRTGIRLQFVYTRSRKFAYLVATGTEAKNGSGALRGLTQGRAKQGRKQITVPIFTLIPKQDNANRVSLDAVIREAERNLKTTFLRYLEIGI